MKPSVLILQCRKREDLVHEEQRIFHREIGERADIFFQNAFDESLDWSAAKDILHGYDAVILGGSGEFDFDGGRRADDEKLIATHHLFQRSKPFFQYLFDKDFPTLAICFGHQMLGRAAGASIVCDKDQSKVGSHKIDKQEEAINDPVFFDLPDSFYAQYGHKDSMDAVPQNATLLAANHGQCKCAALRYGTKVYSVQFHPELNMDDMLWRLQNSPGYIPKGVEVRELIQPAPYAAQILERFVCILNTPAPSNTATTVSDQEITKH